MRCWPLGRRARVGALTTTLCAAGALLAPLAHAQSPLFGPDVASYQHPGHAPISWRRVAGHGARFAFVKATEATTYVNPWFRRDWAATRGAGLVRGAYHYARPALPLTTAVDQARAFVAVVGSTREQGDLPPVLDLEDSGGLPPVELLAWTRTWLLTVQAMTGRVPIIYTYPYFWATSMGADPTFGTYPLWLAAYSRRPPAPLLGWERWTFWQHTASARYPGIVGVVDESLFCCDGVTLAGLADGRTPLIAALWARLGGAGALGHPTGPESGVPGGGWWQTYEHAAIAWTAATGVHAVTGAMWDRYRDSGAVRGPLGVPTSDARRLPAGGLEQRFAHGELVWSAATGAHAVPG